MIPKIIHYCWFGDKPIPSHYQAFINSWKKLMPDYKFICWNENSIDVNALDFTRKAYESGKLAFVADYTRLYALYTMGGIYLDTDVKVLKRFDDYLDNGFFSSVEYHPIANANEYIDNEGHRITSKDNIGISIHSAIIASIANSQYLRECLDYYLNATFSEDMSKNKTIPVVLALKAEKYGFRYIDKEQNLVGGIHIYPSKVFSEYRTCTPESVAIHFCEGSWVRPTLTLKIQNLIKKTPLLFRIYRLIKNKNKKKAFI